MLHKSVPSIAADVDVAKRTVVVYFSKFGNVDLDGDMIMPGSYTKTIQEQGKAGVDAIWHLTDHTGSLRSAIGKPLLEQDGFGLKGTTQIVDTTWGNDVLKLYEAKLINQHSVGYRVVKEAMKQAEIGGPYNEITEIKLYEGSAVLWGANPDTPTVEVKSAAELLLMFNRIEEQLHKGTLTDETFKILQKHYDAIGIALKTLKPTEPGKPTQPEDGKGQSADLAQFKGFFTELFTN